MLCMYLPCLGRVMHLFPTSTCLHFGANTLTPINHFSWGRTCFCSYHTSHLDTITWSTYLQIFPRKKKVLCLKEAYKTHSVTGSASMYNKTEAFTQKMCCHFYSWPESLQQHMGRQLMGFFLTRINWLQCLLPLFSLKKHRQSAIIKIK